MPLSSTAKERNIKSSIKKFFVDYFGSIVSFDKTVAHPDIRDSTLTKWVLVNFKGFQRSTLAEYVVEVYCATRKDPEGDNLTKLTDELCGLFYNGTASDGLTRIPLYDIYTTPWTLLSGMVVQEIIDTPIFRMPSDETKVKILTLRIRWGMQI